jgi:hypothetical protein
MRPRTARAPWSGGSSATRSRPGTRRAGRERRHPRRAHDTEGTALPSHHRAAADWRAHARDRQLPRPALHRVRAAHRALRVRAPGELRRAEWRSSTSRRPSGASRAEDEGASASTSCRSPARWWRWCASSSRSRASAAISSRACSRASGRSPGHAERGLRRLGFTKDEHTPHGFRSTASTRLNEMGLSAERHRAAACAP